jgi:hypothetical protein
VQRNESIVGYGGIYRGVPLFSAGKKENIAI